MQNTSVVKPPIDKFLVLKIIACFKSGANRDTHSPVNQKTQQSLTALLGSVIDINTLMDY